MPLQAPKRLQVSCSMKNFSASQRAAASTPYATVAAEQRTLDRKSLIITSFYRRRRSRCGTAKTRRIAGDSGGAIPIIPYFLKFVKVRCIRKKRHPKRVPHLLGWIYHAPSGVFQTFVRWLPILTPYSVARRSLLNMQPVTRRTR